MKILSLNPSCSTSSVESDCSTQLLTCQYLFFCTSKASKKSTCTIVSLSDSCCTFVRVKQAAPVKQVKRGTTWSPQTAALLEEASRLLLCSKASSLLLYSTVLLSSKANCGLARASKRSSLCACLLSKIAKQETTCFPLLLAC